MILYCSKIENNILGSFTPDERLAKDLGYNVKIDDSEVEKGWDGQYYLKGYVPEEPAPTEEEQRQKREIAYTQEVDPITCHISRLADEEQTPEIELEIAELRQERSEKVEEIKERYPYPVGE